MKKIKLEHELKNKKHQILEVELKIHLLKLEHEVKIHLDQILDHKYMKIKHELEQKT
jgi:hypothetical protein